MDYIRPAIDELSDVVKQWEQLKIEVPDVEQRRGREKKILARAHHCYNRVVKLLAVEDVPQSIRRSIVHADAEWPHDALTALRELVNELFAWDRAGGDGEPIPPSVKQGTKPFINWDDAAKKLHYTTRHLWNLRKPNKPLYGIKPAKDGTVRLPSNFCTERTKKYNSPKNRPQ